MTDDEVFKACVESLNKACKMRKPGIGCINDVKAKLSPAWSNGCLADSQVGKEQVDEPRQEHLTSGWPIKQEEEEKNTLPQEQGATAAAAGELPGPSIFYLLTLDLVICFSYSQISAAKNTKPLHPDKRPR